MLLRNAGPSVMRDPLTWSLPLGRLFGITVRVHILFPFVAAAVILRAALKDGAPPGVWLEALLVVVLLFFSVLLHELGHCFGARVVDGDATEIMLWPLGGLAYIEVPHTARANFIATLAGPLVNVVLCLATGLALGALHVRPPLNPWWVPITYDATQVLTPDLYGWDGALLTKPTPFWTVLLARFFWVNWILFLLNMVLVGFPMDAGRLLQCILWPRVGFRQATVVAIFCGFITMLVVGVYAVVKEDTLFLCLGLFIYATCRQQLMILEHGGEESLFGYDFSQGYTSLERDQPTAATPRRRVSWWRRWLQNRARKKMERQQEQRVAEERRMDELLEKVQRQGLHSLTDEERRFLTRVSSRYKNRQ
jgi:stage IV sporulation protein FB